MGNGTEAQKSLCRFMIFSFFPLPPVLPLPQMFLEKLDISLLSVYLKPLFSENCLAPNPQDNSSWEPHLLSHCEMALDGSRSGGAPHQHHCKHPKVELLMFLKDPISNLPSVFPILSGPQTLLRAPLVSSLSCLGPLTLASHLAGRPPRML